MFHAERLKYRPLKGYRLLAVGLDTELVAQLSALCHSFEIFLQQSNEVHSVSAQIEKALYHFVLLDTAAASKLEIPEEKQSAIAIPVVIRKPDERKPNLQYNELMLQDDEAYSNAAIRILDKLLSINETPVLKKDEMEEVKFEYLKQTFSGQEERYRQLLEMMQQEFSEVREEIKKSLDQHDLAHFREYKHKIQPSANYLRLMDLIHVLEAVKQNFDQLDHVNNQHLVPKMMRYFDNILAALHEELDDESH